MENNGSVTIVDGVIRIDHPVIEAGLSELAQTWHTTVEDALGRVLERALAGSRSG